MKLRSISALLLISITPVMAQQNPPAAQPNPAKPAAAQPAAKTATSDLTPQQRAFSNLPEEKRVEYAKSMNEAARLFNQKRVFESIDEIEKARKIFDENAAAFNLLGSCYVEFRSFDKAMEYFKKAQAMEPENMSVAFNIAEVAFVSKQWKLAHDSLNGLMKKIDAKQTALLRLIEFKVMLCKIKLGQRDEALKMAEKYDYLDDSPYYYCAHAAISFSDGDELKAAEWLGMAARIFRDPAILAPWEDTLVEFGYIKSFYGDGAQQ